MLLINNKLNGKYGKKLIKYIKENINWNFACYKCPFKRYY